MLEQELFYSPAEVADMLSISKRTLLSWENSGKLVPKQHPDDQTKVYTKSDLVKFLPGFKMFNTNWAAEMLTKPIRDFYSIELFAGAGGLALGLEKAGFKAVLLNEIDKDACQTMKTNRPEWDVRHDDIANIDFKPFAGKVDFLSGGFPCQAFSYAGKKLGFEDIRGTLFYQFARAVKEAQPKVFLGENVRGLLKHDNGRTLDTIKEVIRDLGYTLVEPRVLKAVFFMVPQKRERLFLVGIRNDLAQKFKFGWPSPFSRILLLRDALKAGILFPCDVPVSSGQKYPKRKKEILDHVPPGGYWRDLPEDLQKEYMQGSYFLQGGKTGMARRLSYDEPSLTLTCAPAQKQTERCHPEETRPLTVREYARIQTFPEDWHFCGSLSSQYKQIGNAVPVNLAFAMGRSLIRLFNDIEEDIVRESVSDESDPIKQMEFAF